MKILVVANRPDSGWGIANFYEAAFRSLGHDVRLSVADNSSMSLLSVSGIRERLRARIERCLPEGLPPDCNGERLVAEARAFSPDITIVCRGERLTAAVVSELRAASKAACVNVYTDQPFVVPGPGAVRMAESLHAYDAILTYAKSLVPVFYQLGARRVEWLPFACAPECHYSVPPRGSLTPIVYLGSWGPIQERLLTMLAPLGLSIFGSRWHYLPQGSDLRRCVRPGGIGPGMRTAIANSSIVFNLVRAEAGCAHSMKTFEIPACGGFMLSNRTAEQALFFGEDEQASYFDSDEELIAKAKHYLGDSAARERMKESAAIEAAKHTYASRGRALIQMVESGSLPPFEMRHV